MSAKALQEPDGKGSASRLWLACGGACLLLGWMADLVNLHISGWMAGPAEMPEVTTPIVLGVVGPYIANRLGVSFGRNGKPLVAESTMTTGGGSG